MCLFHDGVLNTMLEYHACHCGHCGISFFVTIRYREYCDAFIKDFCPILDLRQQASDSCSQVLEAMRLRRHYLGTARNFAPYTATHKNQSWTLQVVCLSSIDVRWVPCSVVEREILVQTGLGEKIVTNTCSLFC